jgi:hypothetical protein
MPATKTTTNDDGASWKQTSRGASPKDGEQVMVRRKGDRHLLPMIFYSKPSERWESPDGKRAFDFQYFDEWRRS